METEQKYRIRSDSANIRLAIKMIKKIRRLERKKKVRKLEMGSWVSGRYPEEGEKFEDILHSCNTRACFAGFLGMNEAFADQGVKPDPTGGFVIPHIGATWYRDGMRALFGFDVKKAGYFCATGTADSRPYPKTCDILIEQLEKELKTASRKPKDQSMKFSH